MFLNFNISESAKKKKKDATEGGFIKNGSFLMEWSELRKFMTESGRYPLCVLRLNFVPRESVLSGTSPSTLILSTLFERRKFFPSNKQIYLSISQPTVSDSDFLGEVEIAFTPGDKVR